VPDDEQKKDAPQPDETAKPSEGAPAEAAAKGAEPADDAKGEDEAKAEPVDRFDPAAIAARVAGMGEESDIDRLANEEERKLHERKRGKKGKKGLEAAASKRLAKIGEGKVKRPSAIADAVTPDADPLLERAARFSKWIKEHRQTFGGVVAVALLGGAGAFGYVYWQNKHDADASALLAQAYAAERGHVSDKEDEDDEDTRAKPLYPTFKSADDRRGAALAKYREVESKYDGTGAAILAKLGEAGLLLDAGDAKGAIDAYGAVKASALAQADAQVRGRAIEGTGFAYELLAQKDAAGKDKHLDDALAAFKQLEGIDLKGFKELGQYHEARVYLAKGDKPKAIELLKDVHKRVTEPGESHPFAYLEFVVEDRLRALDPTALPPKASRMAGPGGNIDTSDPQIQQLLRQLQQQQAQQNGGAPPVPPPAPK
jgi:hypothetical protein